MGEFENIDYYSYRNSGLGRTNSDLSNQSSPSRRPVDKEQAVQTVRSMIQSRDSGIDRTDDKFILRFLRARKMNVEESYQLMVNYYSFRTRNEELFTNLSTEDPLIKQALYDGFPGVLKSRDRKGRCILVLFCANWDQANYPLEVIFRTLLLSLERLILDPQNQTNGFVLIIDWTDMSLRQLTSLTPKTLKLIVECLQDCFPARFKGVHFINQPWFIEPVIAVLKAFLKEIARKRIYSHGNNLSTLHEHVPKDALPTDLGGEGPPFNTTLWADNLLSNKVPFSIP